MHKPSIVFRRGVSAFAGLLLGACAPAIAQPVTGACCLPNGLCLTTTSDECATTNGEYRGDGTSCEIESCANPERGACCIQTNQGRACVIRTVQACAAQEGEYQGNGTLCGDKTCPPCACDYDNSGLLDTADFFEFVEDFLRDHPRSDYNQDGVRNSQDFFDFLDCFFNPPAPCPL